MIKMMRAGTMGAGALALMGALAMPSAVANTPLSPFVGVSVGTLGFDLQGGLQLRPNLAARLVLGDWELDKTLDIDGIDYDLDARLKMPQLLLDYHPFGSGFFISGGLVQNSSRFGGWRLCRSRPKLAL